MKCYKKSERLDYWQLTRENYSKSLPDFIKNISKNKKDRFSGYYISLWEETDIRKFGGMLKLFGGEMFPIHENDYIVRDNFDGVFIFTPAEFNRSYGIIN